MEQVKQKPSRPGIFDWSESLGLIILGFLAPMGLVPALQYRTQRSNIPCLTEERIGDTIGAATKLLQSFYSELVRQLERRLNALNAVLKANEYGIQQIKELPWYKAIKPSNHRRLVELNAKILGLRGEIAGIQVALLDLANVRPVSSTLKSIVDREVQVGRSVGPPVVPTEHTQNGKMFTNHTEETKNSPLIKG